MRVCHQPPDDGESGGICLAGSVGGLDCDPGVVAEGFEELSLVWSQRHSEALGDEPVGLVSPFGAFARCGCVGGDGVHWGWAPLPWLGPAWAPLGVIFTTFVVGGSNLNCVGRDWNDGL